MLSTVSLQPQVSPHAMHKNMPLVFINGLMTDPVHSRLINIKVRQRRTQNNQGFRLISNIQRILYFTELAYGNWYEPIQDQGRSLLLKSLPGLIVVIVFVITMPLNSNLTSEMRSFCSVWAERCFLLTNFTSYFGIDCNLLGWGHFTSSLVTIISPVFLCYESRCVTNVSHHPRDHISAQHRPSQPGPGAASQLSPLWLQWL